MKTPVTLQQAIQHFADYENCRAFMVEIRWPNGSVQCPQCGSEKLTYLQKARVYRCYGEQSKQKFSLKVGTIFEDSPIPVEKWLPAVWLLVNCKNGISSYEVHRALGVTQKTAWFMMHRIRLAMQTKSFKKLGGEGKEIEADETFIGGAARFMHAGRRRRVIRGWTPIYTDALMSYMGLREKFQHDVIDHANSYVRGRVHTNGLENFWSLLKRRIRGSYVSVEPFHLFRYLDEQAFRYNNRDKEIKYADRFAVALSQIAGRRLTFAEVTGKVGERAD